MPQSFFDAARSVTRRLVPLPVVEATLTQLGARIERAQHDRDAERLAALVNQFVRNIPGLSVRESAALERDLLLAVQALPTGEKQLPADSAIALIALRNHLRYLTVCAGLEWSDAMILQSAVSELARLARDAGGGRFLMSLDEARICVRAEINQNSTALDLASFEATIQGSTATVRVSEGACRTIVCIDIDAAIAPEPDHLRRNA